MVCRVVANLSQRSRAGDPVFEGIEQ